MDFLGIDVNKFLVLTQRETIPFLVLTGRADVLQRIASARRPDSSIQDLCLSPPTNLSAILAFLLMQPATDVEHYTMSRLTDVAPGLHNTDLASLIKIDSVQIACEMLKIAGDEDESNMSKVSTNEQIKHFYFLLTFSGLSLDTAVRCDRRACAWVRTV